MSQKTSVDMRETISALVDGEASDWEVRKALQQSADDDSIKEDWAAYQTLGSVLRKEAHQGIDISAAIMQSVEEESTHSKFGYFKRSISQTAIAASVAVIALIGVQQYQVAQNDVTGTTTIAESNMQTDVSPVVQAPEGFEFQPVTRPVSASSSQPAMTQGSQIQIPLDRDQLKAHLDELVQEHSENSVNSSQGVIPMVRVPASSEAE